MRRFKALFIQDIIILSRNSLMWVVAGSLVAIILVVRLVIPSDYNLEETYYFFDASEQGYLEMEARRDGIGEAYILKSLDELEAAVQADPGSMGVLFDDSGGKPEITLLHYGIINNKNLNLISAALEAPLRPYYGLSSGEKYAVEFLRPPTFPVPQNLNALPPLIAFEVIVLGFLMAAVLLFDEKAEGTNRAYRVSPGGAGAYVLTKGTVFSVIGLFYGFLMIIPTVGVNLNYPALLLTLFFGSFIYTCMGLAVAVFFRNISEWLFIGIALLIVNMTPVISYGWPSFAPDWVTWLPSYPIIFGLREILFPTGKNLSLFYFYLLVAALIAFLLSYFAVNRKMMREGR